MHRRIVSKYLHLNRLNFHLNQIHFFSLETPHTPAIDASDAPYSDVPKPRRDKSERKPYPTPIKELIRRAKLEREARKAQPCRMLEHPPDNGLLVPELVPVAHRVYRARESLLSCLSKLVDSIPILRCRFCTEVHVGEAGHEIRTCNGPGSGTRSAMHVWTKGGVRDVIFFPKCFHLHDRVGKPRIGHDERRKIPRIPAIVELCIQAGVEIKKYPTRRRTKPVYSVEGRIVDFEQVMGMDESCQRYSMNDYDPVVGSNFGMEFHDAMGNAKLDQNADSFSDSNNEVTDLRELGVVTMDSWFEMISGAKKIMEKYSVLTCGYCPEVQVGPKGHKVRMCKATKHQSRDGQHAWQEATIDDLVGPNYVWHVRDLNGTPLDNNLKRYYGKAPAVVELCVQAGAPVPEQYWSMMRLDVVPPGCDEVDLVA